MKTGNKTQKNHEVWNSKYLELNSSKAGRESLKIHHYVHGHGPQNNF